MIDIPITSATVPSPLDVPPSNAGNDFLDSFPPEYGR